jgi:TolB-like protein
MTTLPASALDLQAGVERLVQDLIQATPEGQQLRVAVADFPDLQGVTDDLGRYIATRITTRLGQSKKFSVTERQRLTQVLAELKLSMSALVDPEQAKKLQKMVGVDALVVGTITDLGKQVDVDARLIEIEANRMLWSASVTVDKDPTLEKLQGRGQGRMVEAPMEPGGTDGNVLAELRENQSNWVINAKNYNLVDSQLSAQGLFTAYVKNAKWNNYAVEFDMKTLGSSLYGFSVLIRRQSDTDYVALQLREWHFCGSRWVIAKDRKETVVVGSEMRHDCAGHYRIEVDGDKYKLFKDGSQMFVFTNKTFANGGVGLKSHTEAVSSTEATFSIDNFKVVRLQR